MNFIILIISAALMVSFSSAILPGYYKSKNLTDRNLLLMLKRKFENFYDPYLDDDYYKPDAEFLRSANKKCVFNKFNLIDVDDVTVKELKHFDPVETFDDQQEDLNTLALFVMYSCIDDWNNFINHDFSNFINKPRFLIPKESTECAKNELKKIKKLKPLLQNFSGLKNFTKKQCNRILNEIKSVNESWDIEFRGCLKIYDELSLEYALKFAIMNHEVPDEEIYNEEKEKYGRELRAINDKFVDCLIKKIL